jgi:hypothetical protein
MWSKGLVGMEMRGIFMLYGTKMHQYYSVHLANNYDPGRLMCVCTEAMQLEAGLISPIYMQSIKQYDNLLINKTWMGELWSLPKECNATAILANSWTPHHQKEVDRVIIDLVCEYTESLATTAHILQ